MSSAEGVLEAVRPDASGWSLACTADAVQAPGSYVTCHVGRTPLIVVRGADDVLRAFVNMCRHRGMALLEGCGQIDGMMVCPYHAWRFDTEGRLRVIAQKAQFPDVDPALWGLLPASVEQRGGLVFAHEDEDAPGLDPALVEATRARLEQPGAAGPDRTAR